MAITFDCAYCGEEFTVADELGGRRGRCKWCKQVMRIPEAEPSVDDPFGLDLAGDRGPAASDPLPPRPPAPSNWAPSPAPKPKKKKKSRAPAYEPAGSTDYGPRRGRYEGESLASRIFGMGMATAFMAVLIYCMKQWNQPNGQANPGNTVTPRVQFTPIPARAPAPRSIRFR